MLNPSDQTAASCSMKECGLGSARAEQSREFLLRECGSRREQGEDLQWADPRARLANPGLCPKKPQPGAAQPLPPASAGLSFGLLLLLKSASPPPSPQLNMTVINTSASLSQLKIKCYAHAQPSQAAPSLALPPARPACPLPPMIPFNGRLALTSAWKMPVATVNHYRTTNIAVSGVM